MKEFVRIHEAAKKEAEEKGIPFEGEYQTPKLSYYKVRQVSRACVGEANVDLISSPCAGYDARRFRRGS